MEAIIAVREVIMTKDELKAQILLEIAAINNVFRSFRVRAKTSPQQVVIGGDQLVIYNLQRLENVTIKSVQNREKELTEVISECRNGKETFVRILEQPLRIEVSHPDPKPLVWNMDVLRDAQPAHVLMGRTYENGGQDLFHNLDGNNPHILIAGTTGAGKSGALMSIILSACYSMSPTELRLIVIDLKNTDLIPLARLAHTERLVTDVVDARNVLVELVELLKERQGTKVKAPRIVIVIDEYADLSKDKISVSAIGKLTQAGRSSGINLVVATQHPTTAEIGNSSIKSNMSTRFVGAVTDSMAARLATGRSGTGAHLLPGNGSFLYVVGRYCIRTQTYFMTDEVINLLIAKILHKTVLDDIICLKPVLKGSGQPEFTDGSTRVEPVPEPDDDVVLEFPIRIDRMLNADEVDYVKKLDNMGVSKNTICRTIYGSKNGAYMAHITKALA